MKYKKMAIAIAICFFIFFLVLYGGQDVFDIVDKKRPVPKNVKVLIRKGYFKCSSYSILSTQESSALLSKCKNERFRTSETEVRDDARFWGIYGELWVIPRFFDFWPLNVMMPYVRKSVYVEYEPWKQLLFLSKDCEELGWEYYEGFCVSNIPPTMLKVDMEKMESWRNRIKAEHARQCAQPDRIESDLHSICWLDESIKMGVGTLKYTALRPAMLEIHGNSKVPCR